MTIRNKTENCAPMAATPTVSAAPVFALPESFEAAAALPGKLAKRTDDANWLLSTIIRKSAHQETDDYGYARLDSRILRRVMSRRDQPAVVRALVNADWIRPPAPYCPGVKCKGYALTVTHRDERCKLVPASDPHITRRIHRECERLRVEALDRWLPVHHALNRAQHGLTIGPEADAIVAALKDAARLGQYILVADIRNGNFRFSIGTTGRVFNAITGLKRELRKALRLDGEPIAGVDIRCTQPALLAMLMGRVGARNVTTYIQCLPPGVSRLYRTASPWPLSDDGSSGFAGPLPSMPSVVRSDFAPASTPDFRVFQSLVCEGDLYDDLVRRCAVENVPLPDDPRESVKKALLRDVIAKRGAYPCVFEDVFRRAFPSVYRFVRCVNRDDHRELVRILQRLESWLVVETVAPLFVDRIPILTLHDAIYARARDVGLVQEVFTQTFQRLGFRLALKSA